MGTSDRGSCGSNSWRANKIEARLLRRFAIQLAAKMISAQNRRRFLQFLASSPLLSHAWAQQAQQPLASAKDALNVMEFEEMAHRALPPAHWGYMASGVDDDATLKANIGAFKHIQLRPRRLVDVSKNDHNNELL